MKAYASLAGNIFRSNFRRSGFPYKLTFATTYSCNYRCKTCGIWHRKSKDELTLEEIDQFFACSNRFNWIDFTGGEPWLRNDFPDIVESAMRHCRNLLLVHFPTNGYLTERIVEGTQRILKKRPRKLVISVSTDGDEALNDVGACDLTNRDLLEAVRALAFTERQKSLWRVDYRNLGSEELGSVYESLLELHPRVEPEAGTFDLGVAAGSERKTTGSYYTPHALVQSLLDTALEPILDEAARAQEPQKALLSLKVCDPACGSGHFLVAAAHRIDRVGGGR